MKSVWNGSIAFGLVSIPVQLFSVAQEHILGFKMLCGTCNRPIRMKRWCDHCKKEVAWDNVAKGLELSKGEYFVLTQDVVKSIKPVKTTSIRIVEFIDAELVDPVYFNTHYYAAPVKLDRAYTLFQHALGSMGKVAIGDFVMRDREQVCMIQSYRSGLLMTTLYYNYEVRPVENIAILQEEQPTISANELKLAKQLIDQLTKKKFDITNFKDTFAEELKKLVKQKKEGKVVKLKEEIKVKKGKRGKAGAPSLMEALEESLKGKKGARR
ncbi:MAG TPA: Ku protein [Candidatus Babeliales bacterium]|nr:Ku protein [Candidatus Babeliales bacterium]